MWTPKWFDVLFALLLHPATWDVIGVFIILLVGLLVRAAWRAAHKLLKGGE